MADEQLIKPRELPAATTVFADDAIMTDNGSVVGKATPVQIVNAGAPVPTEAEAIAGADNSKRMTPLTVKQVLDSVTAPSVLRAQAWAESDSPPDPGIPSSMSAKSWAAESERLGAEQADRAEAAAQIAEDVIGGPGALQVFVDEAAGWAGAAEGFADAAELAATAADLSAGRVDLGALDDAVTATAADRVQTGLDRTAAAARAAQAAAEKAAAEAARIAAQAAADAAFQAGQWKYEVETATGLSALTGMSVDDLAFTKDNQHVWRWDGSAWVDRGQSPLALKAERASLTAVVQSIGYPGEIPDGDAPRGNGTYTLTTPITKTGRGGRVGIWGLGNGTVYAQIVSRAGDTFTIVREQALTIVPGYQVVELPNLEYEAGQLFGIRAGSGMLQASSAPLGYGYWSTNTAVTEGNSYIDDTISNTAIHVRFEVLEQVVTGPDYLNIRTVAMDTGAAVGTVDLPGAVIGRVGEPEAGVAAGTANYLLDFVAPYDLIMTRIRAHTRGAGVFFVSSWDGDASHVEQDKIISFSTGGAGVITVDNPGFILKKGQIMGLARGTAGLSITLVAPGVDPTPYRSIVGTSGAPGAVATSGRFEVSADFEPLTLQDRVSALEGNEGSDAGLPLPDTYHLDWSLSESHGDGRSLVLSPVVLPSGAGYAYRRATETLGDLKDPTGNGATAISGSGRGSFYPAFGEQIWRMSCGRVGAIVVNSSLGSTTVGNQWASGGAAWLQAVEDWGKSLAAAKSDGLIISGVSISIAIGSNDAAAATSKAAFKAGLIDLIARARTLIGAGDAVPVVLVQTGPFTDGTNAARVLAVQEAQAEIVRETPCVYMGYSARYSVARGQMIDNVHFNQSFNDACGRSLAVPALVHGSGLYPAGLE